MDHLRACLISVSVLSVPLVAVGGASPAHAVGAAPERNRIAKAETAVFYESFDSAETISTNGGFPGVAGTSFVFVEDAISGKALDARGAYAAFPIEDKLASNEGAITFWFKPQASASDMGFFDAGRLASGQPNCMGFFAEAGGALLVRINDGAGTAIQGSASGIYAPNIWNHFAFTWRAEDSTSYQASLYLNGLIQAKWSYKDVEIVPMGELWIGFSPFKNASGAHIDEFRIFAQAKDENEIFQMYANANRTIIPSESIFSRRQELSRRLEALVENLNPGALRRRIQGASARFKLLHNDSVWADPNRPQRKYGNPLFWKDARALAILNDTLSGGKVLPALTDSIKETISSLMQDIQDVEADLVELEIINAAKWIAEDKAPPKGLTAMLTAARKLLAAASTESYAPNAVRTLGKSWKLAAKVQDIAGIP